MFSSDMPYAIHAFQYNSGEHGKIEITIGQLSTITFSSPFDDTPQIYLTPESSDPQGYSAEAVAANVSVSNFRIYSSGSPTAGWTKQFNWSAQGNRDQETIPIWRNLITSSKDHQLRKDFRAEVVDLESAFEIFVDEYLAKSLKSKLRDETVDWILGRSIDEKLKVGFIELSGQGLSKLHRDAHGRWKNNVKQVRDLVVHRGNSVTPEQALRAREAVFELMTQIDYTTLDFLGNHLTTSPLDGPSRTFGTAIGTGSQLQIKHGLPAVPSDVTIIPR